jgi:hypothetical protein
VLYDETAFPKFVGSLSGKEMKKLELEGIYSGHEGRNACLCGIFFR